MKKRIISKIWPIIKKQKMLRTLCLLSIVFVFLSIGFLVYNGSLISHIKANEELIAKNDATVMSLQQLALHSADEGDNVDMDLFSNKSFAGYEEVVPFITYMEKLLAQADPAAEVAIKSNEDQIFLDHFADYRINVKIADKDELFEALDELYNSRFITKILNFTMHYKPMTENERNEFTDFEFTIRLYLK